MRILILVIFAVASASAIEDYNAPEWQPIDWSSVVPVDQIPGFWKGTVYEKFALKSHPRVSRIVGGDEVVPHSHPNQVYLLLQLLVLTSACGGSIISPSVILTAAHCVTNVRSVTVVAGAHNVQLIENTQQRRTVEAEGFRIHPEYSRPNVLNDIATIILSTPLTFTPYVQQSVLAPENAGTFVGFVSRAVGWGRVADGAPASNVLRGVNNTILANSVCEGYYGNVAINQDTICIDTTGGRGVCNGDSGGTLSVFQNGGLMQVGIASFVHSSGCESGIPHVFERVSGHRGWLSNNMS